VRAAIEGDNGVIWIGTATGLDRYERASKLLTHFGEADGLPSGYIAGLAQDASGMLWISTDRGIVRFDVAGKRVKRYTTADGLQGNEYNGHAYFAARDGTLFFGGNNGFNVVRPAEIRRNDRRPPVVLTGFQLFNREVPIGAEGSPLAKHVARSDRVVLSYKQSVMTLSSPRWTTRRRNRTSTRTSSTASTRSGSRWVVSARRRTRTWRRAAIPST
jgi:ligand-binding sensor domain-containing protein